MYPCMQCLPRVTACRGVAMLKGMPKKGGGGGGGGHFIFVLQISTLDCYYYNVHVHIVT